MRRNWSIYVAGFEGVVLTGDLEEPATLGINTINWRCDGSGHSKLTDQCDCDLHAFYGEAYLH